MGGNKILSRQAKYNKITRVDNDGTSHPNDRNRNNAGNGEKNPLPENLSRLHEIF